MGIETQPPAQQSRTLTTQPQKHLMNGTGRTLLLAHYEFSCPWNDRAQAHIMCQESYFKKLFSLALPRTSASF